ncbi:MAG: hypothetical protein M5R36_03420 [Deltaproteobacteria bacterium]|nr:hypothetical protein [Deltaproteobacteria bacterium]
MRSDDVAAVASLHARYIRQGLWAHLGETFLRTIYGTLLRHQSFLGYVYVDGDSVLGFIAGSTDAPAMMRDIFRRYPVRFITAAALGLLRRPSLIGPILQTFRYFDRSGIAGLGDVRAESLFCCFEPELRGKRISGLINKILFDELARRGHRYVKITTRDDNEGAIRQLTSWGFERLGTFSFYGRPMIAWRLDLVSLQSAWNVSLPRLHEIFVSQAVAPVINFRTPRV